MKILKIYESTMTLPLAQGKLGKFKSLMYISRKLGHTSSIA